MPSNRRLPRTIRNSVPLIMPGFMGENVNHRYAALGAKVPTLPALEQPPAPKHFPFPCTSADSDLFFEILIFFFTITSSGLQFIHLYRTIWWLPNSYTNQALNFYLIDTNLIAFIIVLLGRRLIYVLGCKVLDIFICSKDYSLAYFCYRIALFFITVGLLFGSAYRVMENHPLMHIFYLCYPISVYLILFGMTITPFFELIDWSTDCPCPLHACSIKANDIRQEVENLKANFNNRMKQILFSSLLSAYYAGFVPLCFAQSYLHYDLYWATQHAVFIFLSSFVAYSCHILSLRYCDTLHRSAMHLGNWDKLETRSLLLVNNVWNEDTLWSYGVLVRHGRDVYRAQGECNSSEPGSSAYARFYSLFKNPSSSLRYLLIFHVILVAWQLYLVLFSVLWYNIISLTFILFFNYLILYKVVRYYLISSNIYKEEKLMHDKLNIR